MSYKPPKPEVELDELVTDDIKEPKVEFYGNCKDCEIPLTERYEAVGLCEECFKELYAMESDTSYKNLKN